ncbi:MAG: ABC transporter permease, partial [Bacteroidota bacterium]
MLTNYFKLAWRNLLKSKGTSLINIAGLATGITVVLLIALWIQDEVTYDRHTPTYDRVAQVYLSRAGNKGEISTGSAIAMPAIRHIKDNFQEDFEIASLASWNFQHLLIHKNQRFIRNGMNVEPEFPEIFQLEFIQGDRKKSLQDPYSIIINERLAKALFGDEDPLGKIIRFDTTDDLEVTGVFKNEPHNSSIRNASFFVTWAYYEATTDWLQHAVDNWENHSFQGFVLLKEGIDMKAAGERIKDIEKGRYEYGEPEIVLHAMKDWHLRSKYEDGQLAGGRIQFVWMFGIIGIFVLILACINFMNLSTARSEKRAKEVGIRKTVGSGRGQLIGQFLTESLLIATLSMLLGLFLLQLTIGSFNTLANKKIEIPLDQPMFWFLVIGFTTLVGLLAGSYPAFFLSAFRPIRALRGTSIKKGISSLPRKILVTVQFTVSVALIIGTLVVFQQIQHAKNRPIGYDQSNAIYFYDNKEITDKFELMRTDLLNTGVVEAFSHSSSPVTQIWSNINSFGWRGQAPDESISFGTVAVSHEFGKTVGWDIVAGRDFSRDMATDSMAMVLNEAAVVIMGLENPVGETIQF